MIFVIIRSKNHHKYLNMWVSKMVYLNSTLKACTYCLWHIRNLM